MSGRKGLGRGLDALLPSPSPGTVPRAAVDEIRPNPNQPRRSFDEASIDALAASIRAVGLLQPLVVRPHRERGFVLIAGERRLRAAQRAGLHEVPIVVVDTDDRGSLEAALVENVQRADLNPIEEAAAYRQLIEEGGLTQEALGARVGRDRSTIANTLRLLELPETVQRLIVEGRLTAGHGRALLGLAGNPFLERLARRAALESLSVRETEDLVRRYRAIGGGGSAPPRRGPSPVAAEAQQVLSNHLSARVRVDEGARKGRIVIEFSGADELQRLVELVTRGASTESP